MSLEADASYQRYKLLSREELQLPVPDTNSDGEAIIETGELYCRVQGCTEDRRFRVPYLLRKHLQKVHPDVVLEWAPVRKPTKRDADRARVFYRNVVEAYDARHTAATQVAEGANEAEGSPMKQPSTQGHDDTGAGEERSRLEESKEDVKPAAKRRRLK